MPRQNQNVLRAGRRRKRSCSPGLPSIAPTAKPKPKDPHENDIQFTERYKNRHNSDEVINLLPPSVRPALRKAGRRCPFKEYIFDRLRDDRASHYEKSLYPEDPSFATHPSTDDEDVSASPLNTAHYDFNIEDDCFDVELEPPKKKLPSVAVHFVPLYLIMALNILRYLYPPKSALHSIPPWPPPWVSELLQHVITIFKQSISTIMQMPLFDANWWFRALAQQQIPSFFSFDVFKLQSTINIPSFPVITKELYTSLLQQSIIYTIIAIGSIIYQQSTTDKVCNCRYHKEVSLQQLLKRIFIFVLISRITTTSAHPNNNLTMMQSTLPGTNEQA